VRPFSGSDISQALFTILRREFEKALSKAVGDPIQGVCWDEADISQGTNYIVQRAIVLLNVNLELVAMLDAQLEKQVTGKRNHNVDVTRNLGEVGEKSVGVKDHAKDGNGGIICHPRRWKKLDWDHLPPQASKHMMAEIKLRKKVV
jgi:hypothetical protein